MCGVYDVSQVHASAQSGALAFVALVHKAAADAGIRCKWTRKGESKTTSIGDQFPEGVSARACAHWVQFLDLLSNRED